MVSAAALCWLSDPDGFTILYARNCFVSRFFKYMFLCTQDGLQLPDLEENTHEDAASHVFCNIPFSSTSHNREKPLLFYT